MTKRARSRRRRRALLVLALAGSLVATGGAWLADTGTTTLNIQPAPGLASDGKVASITPLSSSFTRPNGNAQIQAGVAIDKIEIAQGFATSVKLDLAWLNPGDAAQVLNNPNAQIHVGLYYPIYTGTCASGESASVDSQRATITDGATLCTRLDASATGAIVDNGKMILHFTQLSGFIRPGTADPTPTECTSSTENTTWCAPAGLGASKNVLYVAATIATPGGKPAGQQNNVSSLEFFTRVDRVG